MYYHIEYKHDRYNIYRSSYHLTLASNRCLVYATFVRLSFGINFRAFHRTASIPLPDYQPAPTHPLKPNELTWGVVISLKSNWNLMKFKVINCNYMIFHKNVVVTHVVKASK